MSFSNYLENKLLNHAFLGAAFTQPDKICVSLHSADPGETGASELSGNGYARKSHAVWSDATSGSKSNTGAITFDAAPGAAATCTLTTAGGWNFVNPSAGLTSYLAKLSINGSASHTLLIFDRLSEMGGLSGATTGDQNITLSLPANRNSAVGDADLWWFMEIYTDIGTAAQASTITYTDPTDTSRTIAFSIGGASPINRAGRIYPLVPNTGQPFKTLTKINFGTTTGAAGSFGFFNAKLLASVNMGQIYAGMTYDFTQLAMPVVADNACIMLAILNSTTASGTIIGELVMVQG